MPRQRSDPTWMNRKRGKFTAGDWVYYVARNTVSSHLWVGKEVRAFPNGRDVTGLDFQISRELLDALGWRPGLSLEVAWSSSLEAYRIREHRTPGAARIALSRNDNRRGRGTFWMGPCASESFPLPLVLTSRRPEFRIDGDSLVMLWALPDREDHVLTELPPAPGADDWETALARRPSPGTCILHRYPGRPRGRVIPMQSVLSISREDIRVLGWKLPIRVSAQMHRTGVVLFSPAEVGLLVAPHSRTGASGHLSVQGILREFGFPLGNGKTRLPVAPTLNGLIVDFRPIISSREGVSA